MSVAFYGVRGSTPCDGADVARYGGNTSCVSVRIPSAPTMFFDIGTGARYLATSLPVDGSFRGVCLLSHLHWDHVQGLPFFGPLLAAGSELDVYAPAQPDGRTVAEAMDEAIRPPLFPVGIGQLPGTVRFHDVVDGTFEIGPAEVTARSVPHIGPTLGYRVSWAGRSVVYLSDHQQPTDGSFAATDAALELAARADLLVHDAQFTPAEFADRSTWGHCTIDYAVWFALEAGVRSLALFHHDPGRTDDHLDLLTLEAVRRGADRGLEVFAAREGLCVDVAGPSV